MISEKLEAARKRLAERSNSRVYVVIECSPAVIVVLMVPKGAEHRPVVNPMGGSSEPGFLGNDDGDGDWGCIDAPMLVTIDEDFLPATPQPTPLRALVAREN